MLYGTASELSLNGHTELLAAQIHPSNVGRASLIPLHQALLLSCWRGAAAGEKVESLLQAAPCLPMLGSLFQELLSADRSMLCVSCLIKGALLQRLSSHSRPFPLVAIRDNDYPRSNEWVMTILLADSGLQESGPFALEGTELASKLER